MRQTGSCCTDRARIMTARASPRWKIQWEWLLFKCQIRQWHWRAEHPHQRRQFDWCCACEEAVDSGRRRQRSQILPPSLTAKARMRVCSAFFCIVSQSDLVLGPAGLFESSVPRPVDGGDDLQLGRLQTLLQWPGGNFCVRVHRMHEFTLYKHKLSASPTISRPKTRLLHSLGPADLSALQCVKENSPLLGTADLKVLLNDSGVNFCALVTWLLKKERHACFLGVFFFFFSIFQTPV